MFFIHTQMIREQMVLLPSHMEAYLSCFPVNCVSSSLPLSVMHVTGTFRCI